MVSSISGSAGLSAAMLSGTQCRGPREPEALEEKLFSKLDVNGDGGIDASELGELMDFAASAAGGTSESDSAELFKSLDSDSNGTLSKPELADGAKALFDELRTQLMSSGAQAEAKPPGPPPGGGHGGGLLAKIESLLDQYRSTAIESTDSTEASTLSVAA